MTSSSGKLIAPVDTMRQTASQWQALAADFSPPPSVPTPVDFPHQQGVAELLGALHGWQTRLSAQASANGDTLAASADAYAGEDKRNAVQLVDNSNDDVNRRLNNLEHPQCSALDWAAHGLGFTLSIYLTLQGIATAEDGYGGLLAALGGMGAYWQGNELIKCAKGVG
jgi:hypothetical protein